MYGMRKRLEKDRLFGQVAHIGKAISNPKRLEIVELLAQGDKSVDTLTNELGIDIKLASAHLRVLKEANLIQAQRQGKYQIYSLQSNEVALFWVSLRELAEQHAPPLENKSGNKGVSVKPLERQSAIEIQQLANRGKLQLLDVRPSDEFEHGHLPGSISIPIDQLKHRLNELHPSLPVVTYCRGPFCFFADDAVKLLTQHGFQASKLREGVSEWQAIGLPLSYTTQ